MNGPPPSAFFNSSRYEAFRFGQKLGELVVKKYFVNGTFDNEINICYVIDGLIAVCGNSVPSLRESWKKRKRNVGLTIDDEPFAYMQNFALTSPKDLPNELWFKIFTYLPSNFILGTIAMVSERFYNIAHDSPLVKSLNLTNLGTDAIEHVSKSFGRLKSLRELSITNCPHSTKLVPIALDSNTGLKILIVDFYQEEIATFGKNLECLEVICFS